MKKRHFIQLALLLFGLVFPLWLQAQKGKTVKSNVKKTTKAPPSPIVKDTLAAAKKIKQADSLFLKANYNAAIEFYTQAAETYQKYEVYDKTLSCVNKTADAYLRSGEYDKAQKILLDGLLIAEYWESSGSGTPNKARKAPQPSDQANLYSRLGYTYLNKGDPVKARKYLERALDLFDKIKYANKKDLADCYSNLGLMYWNTGNQSQALDYQLRALDLRKESSDYASPEMGASYNNLGLMYTVNDPEKALAYYLEAVTIFEKVYGPKHPNTAVTYNNIGIIERKQKKYSEALISFQKVLVIWQEIYSESHPNIAFVYSNMGQVYMDMGNGPQALVYLKQALEIYKKNFGEKYPEIANTWNLMGTAYQNDRQYDKALQAFQQALIANVRDFDSVQIQDNPSVRSAFFNADLLLISLLLKAQTLQAQYYAKTLKLKDLKYAMQALYVCDSLADHIRLLRSNKNDKIELNNLSHTLYEEAVRINMTLSENTPRKKYYQKEAFYFAEKSKASTLQEAIADASAKHFANLPDSVLDRESQLKTQITQLEGKLAQGADPEKEKEYREKLLDLNRSYQSFASDLEKQFPEYYGLKYAASKRIDVSAIQKTLEDKGYGSKRTLVSYMITDSGRHIYAFALSAKKFKAQQVIARQDVFKTAHGLRNAIRLKQADFFARYSYEMYKTLIRPVVGKGKDELIIIPDGRLGTLPFESLLTSKVKSGNDDYTTFPFLIKRQCVSYHYSASLFAQAQSAEKNAAKDIFILAPVTFEGISDLPGTSKEVSEITEVFGVTHCNACVLGQAQECVLKQSALEEYKYIHLATHGVVDETNPELSRIYLAKDTSGEEDGKLYAGEVYNLKLNAQLVSLSACQTGLGKVVKGEGVIGLSRALLYAGAQNLLVSLWSVSDESTSKLMVDFYKNYLKPNKLLKPSFTRSLRYSKLQLIEDPRYASPYFWAPFILIGK